MKREYKLANKQREGFIDESEEEDENELTRDGKSLKKLMRKLEKNAVYESDEDQNPYASSVSTLLSISFSYLIRESRAKRKRKTRNQCPTSLLSNNNLNRSRHVLNHLLPSHLKLLQMVRVLDRVRSRQRRPRRGWVATL